MSQAGNEKDIDTLTCSPLVERVRGLRAKEKALSILGLGKYSLGA